VEAIKMTTPLSGATPNRRAFLSLIATSAAATVGGSLLAGCSTKQSTSKGAAEKKDALSSLVPSYKSYAGVKPDIPGVDGAPPGFLKYPSNLVRAFEKVRGKGTQFTVMSPLWGSPPAKDNAYYKAIAERTGTPLNWNVQDGNTYADKLTAILGAADVPDILVIPGWNLNIPRINEAIANLFADLTPILKGDVSDRWKMLSAVPTDAWKLCVWNGALKAVPFTSSPFGNYLMYRKDIFEQLGVAPPKNADELFELGKKVTDPSKNRWAFQNMWASSGGAITQVFGVPGWSGWRKDASGKMVWKLETPEYEACVAYMRKLFDAKLLHPSASDKSVNGKQLFESGAVLVTHDGFGGIKEAYARQVNSNPAFRMEPLPAFAHDGGKPTVGGSDPAALFTFVNKKLSKDKVEEYLDLADWSSAPFGTEENMLLNYGVEGVHYKRDAKGTPSYTDQGQKDAGVPTYTFLGGRQEVVSESQYPDYVQSLTSWYNTGIKIREKNLFDGIRVEEPSQLQQAGQPVNDKVDDIIFGRRPVSDLEQIRKEWRASGGDVGRAFYEKIVKDNNL
jgi:putative aldouronate transport system substrate-binding protein